MKIVIVAGARPNFMKVAPIIRALNRKPGRFEHRLIHTGQHYDAQMSEVFFEELSIPPPDVNLGVGSGSGTEQTARVMLAIEPVLVKIAPDLVVVVGDVNSTLAATLAAKKIGQRVAHIEAGLRSFDMSMPEELNRICTDAIADHLFTTDEIANQNLAREGVASERVHLVGNVMIDTLLDQLPKAKKVAFASRLGLKPRTYATLTLHRPSNVDDPEQLVRILDAISDALPEVPIIFPVHPRTRSRILSFGLEERFTREPGRGVTMTDPLSYLELLSLNDTALLALTDSGGIQEETTVLGVPCVTLRDNTERPITVTSGTNQIAGTRPETILKAVSRAREMGNTPRTPPLWDGRAAERIVDVFAEMAA